jgi:acyl-[acyl carrier protein]--UDP-N-acetylglucosamine O-acyltransferase
MHPAGYHFGEKIVVLDKDMEYGPKVTDLVTWLESRIALHPLGAKTLGSPGYAIPALSDCQWIPIRASHDVSADNWLIAPPEAQKAFSFDISPGCKNNVVVIDQKSKCFGRVVIRGSHNTAIMIGSSEQRSPINVHMHSSRNYFFFGRGSTSNSTTFEMGTDGTSCVVGEDCMFSAFIDVTTDDMHAMIDLTSGEHLNPAADILIEPHVWVGMRAMILKGVTVGFGSILGARALVTRDVPRRVAVAGVPASIRKTRVSWVRERVPRTNALETIAALQEHYSCD